MTPAADCTGNLDLGCGSAIESGTPDRDCVNVTSISTWSAIWTFDLSLSVEMTRRVAIKGISINVHQYVHA